MTGRRSPTPAAPEPGGLFADVDRRSSETDSRTKSPLAALQARVHAALPQTQCTRCGYPDCAAYARAVATGAAQINRCLPGGAEGVARLAAITGRPVLPLEPEVGVEAPRAVAWIDESWCIGCTLCAKACPVDCIIGSNKFMHTVIEGECTGCELCIPACPVDCITMENASGARTGWAAWSTRDARAARQRYEAKTQREARRASQRAQQRRPAATQKKEQAAQGKGLRAAPSAAGDHAAAIQAALKRARAKRRAFTQPPGPGTPQR